MERNVLTVAYVPTPLRSLREICESLGVGEKTVKNWIERGAPIAVEGEGPTTRYSAELAGLLAWRTAGSRAARPAVATVSGDCGRGRPSCGSGTM